MNAGTVYIVATPIGNLDDMSFRAVQVLSQVDVIACEDTRETQKLLESADISRKKLMSYHGQSSKRREDEIMELLHNGQNVGLVSDRGTPGISDPGVRLVRRAIDAGMKIVPIPGASAVITALSASGADTKSFWYRGFIPHKKGRQTFLTSSLEHKQTVVFYESPHRIVKCLEQLIEYGIADRPLIVSRELTKLYEEFLRGTATEILKELQNRNSIQGEFVVIIDSQK